MPGGYYTWGTGGHIDTIARFAAPSIILLAEITPEESQLSPIAAESYRRMEENLRRLRAATDQDGRPFRIVRMPAADLSVHTMPSEALGAERLFFPDLAPGEPLTYILGTNYLNGIVANGVVIVPKFWHPGGPESTRLKDERAAEIYRGLRPGHEIVQIDMTALAHCGGGFHCGSLHQPAAAKKDGS